MRTDEGLHNFDNKAVRANRAGSEKDGPRTVGGLKSTGKQKADDCEGDDAVRLAQKDLVGSGGRCDIVDGVARSDEQEDERYDDRQRPPNGSISRLTSLQALSGSNNASTLFCHLRSCAPPESRTRNHPVKSRMLYH